MNHKQLLDIIYKLETKLNNLESKYKILEEKFANQKTEDFIVEARKRGYFDKNMVFNHFYSSEYPKPKILTKGFVRFDNSRPSIKGNIKYYEDTDEFWVPIFAINFYENPLISGRTCIYQQGEWAPIFTKEEACKIVNKAIKDESLDEITKNKTVEDIWEEFDKNLIDYVIGFKEKDSYYGISGNINSKNYKIKYKIY